MDKVIIISCISFILFLGICGSIIDTTQEKEVQALLKRDGSVSNYLHNRYYGVRNYEKIDMSEKYLRFLSFNQVANYYISRGYDVRYVRTGRYDGYYEAIKLK